jgi:hypothetical protein
MNDDAKDDGARERSSEHPVPRYHALPVELLLWLPVGVTPILNGAIRMSVYARWLGEPAASMLSSALDVLVVAAYAVFAQRRRPLDTWPRAAGRGLLWSALTASSHFGLGAFVFGIPWPSLVAKYDLLAGETWPLVSLAILAAPPFARWRAGPVAHHRARATPSSP